MPDPKPLNRYQAVHRTRRFGFFVEALPDEACQIVVNIDKHKDIRVIKLADPSMRDVSDAAWKAACKRARNESYEISPNADDRVRSRISVD